MKKIIIQAGGRGSRLEGLTRNKPKCIVPVDNLPIIFYVFKKFSDAEFFIIADYKTDVLEKYLQTFASDYKYTIIRAKEQGTISGLKDALQNYADDEQVIIVWCDLILSENLEIPEKSGNWLGISKDFECRWSYTDNKFVKIPSKENGVAGLFVFENKKCLSDIGEKGAFVPWLQDKNIKFSELPLLGTKEIGTMIAYKENNPDSEKRWRPFNSIKFENDTVIKEGITEQGKKIAVDESNWYKFVKAKDYKYIPEIYSYEPLKMKKIQGQNIYEYDYLTKSQKEEMLENIITALEQLHVLIAPINARQNDLRINYITKTFERLEKVKNLIPFANDEFIKINSQYYKNIFFEKESFINYAESIFPEKFYLIHGDCTFSNMLFDTFDMKTILIDPRGYFGETKLYGDVDYDWAKLYYSLKGNYDQFNRKKFNLNIGENAVDLEIKTNFWEDMEDYFFKRIKTNRKKIQFLHAVIWLSLTTYAWEDYDSICGAFYNGLIHMKEVL